MARQFGAGHTAIVTNGEATIRLGPVPPRQVWNIVRYAISSSGLTEGKCYLYETGIANNQLIDSTYDGTQNQGDLNIELGPGDTLIFHWKDCDPVGGGPTVTASIRYTFELQ